ncbi:MAG: MBL fold metallo-hydrolase [Acidobacteriota bacterium]
MKLKVRILGSGSSGNSTFLQSGRTRILIDAGFGARGLERRLLQAGIAPPSLAGVIVTHEHSDHIRGLRLFSKKYRMNLYSSEKSFEDSGIIEDDLSSFHCIEAGIPFEIGEIKIHPFSLPHDAESTFGFIIKANRLKLSYATDFGYPSKLVVERMKDSDGIILEANHDTEMLLNGPYPWFLKERLIGRLGHLSNESMAELVEQIVDADTRFLMLAHLSEVNNSPGQAVQMARKAAHRRGAKNLRIMASYQDQLSEMIEL